MSTPTTGRGDHVVLGEPLTELWGSEPAFAFLPAPTRAGPPRGLPEDPYAVYRELRTEGEVVVGGAFGDHAILVLTSHRACVDALRTPHVTKAPVPGTVVTLKSELYEGYTPPFTPSMLTADPPEHTRLRALASRAFTPRAIGQWRDRTHEVAERLIDGFAPEGTTELVEQYAAPLPITVISEVLGVPEGDRERFREWGHVISEVQQGIGTAALRRSADRTREALDGFFHRLLERRRETPGDDLVTALIRAEEDDDRLTTSELVRTCNLLLVAGFETTVNLIGNGVLALLEHPDQLALLRDDPALATNAVEELLRFDAPIQMTFRFAADDLELGGSAVPRGAMLVLLLGAANRDPAVFADPERLDIQRPNAHEHLAFATGIHYCLGAALARLEGEVALRRLLARCPDLRLADGVERRRMQMMRGLEALPVVLGG